MKRFNFFEKDKHETKPGEYAELVPFRSLFDLDTLFENFLSDPFDLSIFKAHRAPAIKVYEENDKVVVKAELPGAEKKNIKIFRNGNILTIQGETRKQSEEKKKNYYYVEGFLTQFQRAIRLPESAKVEGAKAVYADGILTIEFAKDKEVKDRDSGIEIE